MCCVEVASTGASFEYSNRFVILDWEVPKETNEPDLIIDLGTYELLRFTGEFVVCITFNSGLDDIAAAKYVLCSYFIHQWPIGQNFQLSQQKFL